ACLNTTLANGNKACSVLTPASTLRPTIDPNLKLGYAYEYTLGLDQELFPDFNLRANFVRKIEKGAYGLVNSEYSPSDWAPITFTDPGYDGVLGTSDDKPGQIAYNRLSATKPQVQSLVYRAGAGNMYRTF